MTSDDEVKQKYPLHYYAWRNNYSALDELLQQKKYDIEMLDPHGRTPLMLAVVLDNLEAARVLLRHNANASFVSKTYWSVSQEAVATGDPQLLKLVLVHHDAQVVRRQGTIMTGLLRKLQEAPDFYIEMKWEFTSWLPLVSRMCPSDVCHVWKCGPNVRIDTNLIGFNGSASWIRGHLSYIFRVNGGEAVVDEVNHTERVIYRHNIALTDDSARDGGGAGAGVGRSAGAAASAAAQLFVREPSENEIAKKLTQPIFVTFLDTDKIEFEKSKSGFWGWRTDRHETVNNYDCQVYSASNLQIITLRRTEHLTEENLRDLNQQRRSDDSGTNEPGTDIVFPGGHSNLLTNLLQTAAAEAKEKLTLDVSHVQSQIKLVTEEIKSQSLEVCVIANVTYRSRIKEAASYNPNEITIDQYFNLDGTRKSGTDIGRPKQMTTKVKTFKAHMWLSQEYPLSLANQVVPIIDLMSEYNPYFHKLKEFLTKQLPSGFPVKIEIPLYHVLNARISFGNLFGQESTVYGVSTIPASTTGPGTKTPSADSTSQPLLNSSSEIGSVHREPVKCVVDESVFDVGKGYHVVVENSPGHYGALDEEEQMVQMAVQRSLVEYGTADELVHRDYSLRKRSIVEARADEYVEPEEAWLQQAIAASLRLDGAEIPVTQADEAYLKVLEESRREQELEEQRRKREDEELARALELSTREK